MTTAQAKCEAAAYGVHLHGSLFTLIQEHASALDNVLVVILQAEECLTAGACNDREPAILVRAVRVIAAPHNAAEFAVKVSFRYGNAIRRIIIADLEQLLSLIVDTAAEKLGVQLTEIRI